jgi:hypothetical protein
MRNFILTEFKHLIACLSQLIQKRLGMNCFWTEIQTEWEKGVD